MRRCLVIFAILLSTASCTPPQHSQSLLDDATLVSDKLLGVCFKYPVNWTVVRSETIAEMTIAGPENDDGDQPAIFLQVARDDRGRSFDQYVADLVDGLVARGAGIDDRQMLHHANGFEYASIQCTLKINGDVWDEWLIVVPYSPESRVVAFLGVPARISSEHEHAFATFVDSLTICPD